MEGEGVKGLECQKTMDGKASNGNKAVVPSCCLKAMACSPEDDAKCHSTVVSGWFSEPHSISGLIPLLLLFLFLSKLLYFFLLRTHVLFCFFFFWMQGKKAKLSISTTLCGQVGHLLIDLFLLLFSILVLLVFV